MQVYHYIPYPRIAFLAFTVLFHVYLLIRSSLGGRYIMAAILLIPVVGVSIALMKFMKKALITISVESSEVELSTFYGKFNSNIGELSLQGKKLLVSGKEFIINPSKAGKLRETIGDEK